MTSEKSRIPIGQESKVIVHGCTQRLLINPEVRVFWNGERVGSVEKGERISFEIDGDGEVSFRASRRTAALRVPAGQVTEIKISWHRITGKLIPQIVG